MTKISKLCLPDATSVSDKKLILPRVEYGPFCLKILNDFINHHKLSKNLPVPSNGITNHEALSRIFDIMIHSMGDEKRQEILKDLEEYNKGIPPHFR